MIRILDEKRDGIRREGRGGTSEGMNLVDVLDEKVGEWMNGGCAWPSSSSLLQP